MSLFYQDGDMKSAADYSSLLGQNTYTPASGSYTSSSGGYMPGSHAYPIPSSGASGQSMSPMNSYPSHSGAYSDESSRFPASTPVGMAYVPMQRWGEVYDEQTGFEAGTIFPELNLPFLGYRRAGK